MLTKRLPRLIAAILLTVATSVIGSAQVPISIGLVRQDGYLIPIAIVTPELFEKLIPQETLVNGEPLPPQEPDWPFNNLEWTLSYGRGRTPVEIRTLEQVTMPMPYCSDRLGWRTTLKLPPAPKNIAPIRKIGIAVRGTAVEHPEDVTHQPDAASRRAAQEIIRLTHAKEAERFAAYAKELEQSITTSKEVAQLAKQFREYLPDESPEERAKVAVKLAQLRRHSIAGVTTYYFEATKAWGLAPEERARHRLAC